MLWITLIMILFWQGVTLVKHKEQSLHTSRIQQERFHEFYKEWHRP